MPTASSSTQLDDASETPFLIGSRSSAVQEKKPRKRPKRRAQPTKKSAKGKTNEEMSLSFDNVGVPSDEEEQQQESLAWDCRINGVSLLHGLELIAQISRSSELGELVNESET